jgi:uncharacterized protein (TIGR02147 family)
VTAIALLAAPSPDARIRATMLCIYDYTDYRKFLHDRFAEKKGNDRVFTYRHLGSIAGFRSAGFFTQVLQGKTNLSSRMIARLARAFDLTKREAGYFEWMVQFNQAQSHELKKRFFAKMVACTKSRVKTVDAEAYDLYDKWYYSAIRALLHFYRFDGVDYRELARAVAPAITPAQARRAVSVLNRLGFIAKGPNGCYHLTDKHITTGLNTDSIVINNFVINTLDIAKDAFYRFPKDTRSFSSLTLSISAEGYARIKERCDQFRKELVTIAQGDREVNRVYQVNLQAFPMTPLPDKSI